MPVLAVLVQSECAGVVFRTGTQCGRHPLLSQECAHRRVFAQADRALAGRIRFVAALSPTA